MEPDDALPDLGTLLGEAAAPLVAAALEPLGDEVLGVRPSQVRYEPGRRVTVRYATTVRTPGGAERVDTVVVAAHRDGPPDGVALLADGQGHVLGVWRYPNDPDLPGLRSLVSAEGAAHVLGQLGVVTGEVTVRPLVYRPGQRAVLRIDTPGATLYAKLVRPHRAEAVHRAHRALAAHVPVPRSLGWSAPHGLVVLEALPGERLADRLAGGGAVPSPRTLLALLDDLAAAEVTAAPASAARTAAHHARLLRAVVPEARGVVDALEGWAATAEVPADRTVHGDFYEGQLLVGDRGRVTGLLDVDGARRGGAVEDLATLVAHLDGLAHVRPDAAARITSYRRAVERLAADRVDRTALDAAVAGVLLGLATGPFRLQEPEWRSRTRGWLSLAAGRLPAASRERSLTHLSSPSHVRPAT